MSENRLGFRYRVEIKTLTPVHIGSGDHIPPYSELLEFNRGTGDFDLKDESKVLKHEKTAIDAFVNSSGGLFIPGSSMKGAIRTAILFKWLTKGKGRANLDEWLKEIRDIVRADTEGARSPQGGAPKKQNTWVSGKMLYGEKNKYSGFEKLIERACFGDYRDMGSLSISDSDFFDLDSSTVYQVERFDLTEVTHRNRALVYKECLNPGQQIGSVIAFNYLTKNTDQNKTRYSELLAEDFRSAGAVCSLINEFSRYIVNYERQVLDFEEVVSEELDEYRIFLDDLILSMRNAPPNVALLRLGAGKMQFYQTVAMAIHKNYNVKDFPGEEEENWLNYVQLCYNEFRRDDLIPMPWPKTRTLTSSGKLPLGWTKLTFKS